MNKIGEKLHRMRIDAGWSQQRLGRALGHDQAWVSRREVGIAQVTLDDLKAIAEALGYAADVVISQRLGGEVLSALANASDAQLALVLLVLDASMKMDPAAFGVVTQLLRIGAEHPGPEAA